MTKGTPVFRGLSAEQLRDLFREGRAKLLFNDKNPGSIEDMYQGKLDSSVLVVLKQREAIQRSVNSLANSKQALTKLDGVERGDGFAGESVAHRKGAQKTEDFIPFYDTLRQEGLWDDFINNRITKQLMDEMEGRDTGVPEIKKLAKVLTGVLKGQMFRMNKAGANIQWLEGFSGLSQVHNSHKIRKTPFEDWARTMLEIVDWDKTRKAHGDLGLFDETANEWLPFNETAYLKSVYNDIVNGTLRDIYDSPVLGGSLSSHVGHHRLIHFLPGQFHGYDLEYGSQMPSQGIISQILKRADQTVILQEFGPNFEQTRIAIRNALKGQFEGKQEQGFNGVYEQVTGQMDNPVDQDLAIKGQQLRQYSNLAFLWQSGLSALNDMPSIVAALKYQGIDVGMLDSGFWGRIIDGYKRSRTDPNDAGTMWLRAQGAGLNAVTNTVARRFTGDTPGYGKITEWNNRMFNWNGLNFITTLGQETTVDFLSINLAKPDDVGILIKALERYGISGNDYDSIKGLARVVDGMGDELRLTPDMIEDSSPVLARKFRNYFDSVMREAVIEPDPGTEAILRGAWFTEKGVKAGTYLGETLRSITQYLAFPLAVTRKTYGRFLHGYGDKGFMELISDPNNRIRMHMLSFMGSMIATGYVVTVIKDILKGRKPMLLHDMNENGFMRAVQQSGVLGILGNALEIQGSSDPVRSGVSPLASNAIKLLKASSFDNDKDVFNAITTLQESTPGVTIPFVNEVEKEILSLILADSVVEYEKGLATRNTGVNYFYNQSP